MSPADLMHVPLAPPSREPWRRTTFGLALGIRVAMLLLVEGVLKDWLMSAYGPGYPLVAYVVTGATAAIAVILPLVVRRASLLHGVVLAGAGVGVCAHLAGLVPEAFGIVPSVPVLACAMALSRLLVVERASERQQAGLAGVLGLGLVALVDRPESSVTGTAWGIVAAVAGTAAVIALVRLNAPPSPWERPTARRWTPAILAVAAAPALLFAVSMRPLASFPLTRLALAGLGLGWPPGSPAALRHGDLVAVTAARPSLAQIVMVLAVSLAFACLLTSRLTLRRRLVGVGILVVTLTVFAPARVAITGAPDAEVPQAAAPAPSALPFVVTLAREQGVLVVALVLLLLLLAAVTAAVVVARWRAGAARDEQFALAAGGIGALAGMVAGAPLGAPFLTADSTLGTAAFAAVLASLAVSLDARPGAIAVDDRPSGAHRGRRRRVLTTASVLLLGIAAALVAWERSERRLVLPLVGSGPPPGYDTYVPLARVSPAMQAATVAFENPFFYEDHGFEWRSIFDAMRRNVREARIMGGGSGITQQLAKNLFLTPHRTLRRKLREAMLTIALDRRLSKARILEIYLNTIDYGMGQRGIAAAARFYFDTTPDRLDVGQSAMLVGLVPHPPRHRVSLHDLRVGQQLAFVRLRDRWPADYGDDVLAKAQAVPLELLLRVPASLLADEARVSPSTSERVADPRGVRLALTVATAATLVLLGWLFARSVARPVGELEITSRRRDAMVLLIVAVTSGPLAMGWWWERATAERAGRTVLARYIASPNWNQRPAAAPVSVVVLHATVDEDPAGVVRFFGDFTAEVSAHFVVTKEGEVVQLVPVEGRAWHAGRSVLGDVTDVNNISVGIEIVNRNDGLDPYPRVQFDAVVRLIRELRTLYPISLEAIVSHAEIARPVGRKSDPRGFDFDRLRMLLARGTP